MRADAQKSAINRLAVYPDGKSKLRPKNRIAVHQHVPQSVDVTIVKRMSQPVQCLYYRVVLGRHRELQRWRYRSLSFRIGKGAFTTSPLCSSPRRCILAIELVTS
jgi:hypothetical protein